MVCTHTSKKVKGAHSSISSYALFATWQDDDCIYIYQIQRDSPDKNKNFRENKTVKDIHKHVINFRHLSEGDTPTCPDRLWNAFLIICVTWSRFPTGSRRSFINQRLTFFMPEPWITGTDARCLHSRSIPRASITAYRTEAKVFTLTLEKLFNSQYTSIQSSMLKQ